MFPGYGGRRGGGGGGHSRNNRGNQGNVWDAPPPGVGGPGNSSGFMLDRGGPPQHFQGHRGGGGGHRGGGGHGNRRDWDGGGGSNRGNRDRDQRGFSGGYQQEVVEINSSDDDNVVEDAARGQSRKRNRSRSPSRSHSSHKRKKDKRSRSRSPHSRGHHHHHHRRDNNQDDRNRDNNRGGRGNGNRHDHHRDRGQYHGNQQQNYDRYSERDRAQVQPPQQPLFPGPPGMLNFNEPPPPGVMIPGMMPMMPFVLDNNPFNQFQALNNFLPPQFLPRDSGPPDRRNFNDRVPRNFDGGRDHGHSGYRQHGRQEDSFQSQEMRRVQVSQSYPKKVFLEEVNLDSEFAFRIDTNSNPGQVNYRSIAMSQKSCYDGGVGKGIFGATDDEISKVYSKFHAFRCKLPDNVNDSEDSQQSAEEGEGKSDAKKESLAKNFISFEKEQEERRRGQKSDGRVDTARDFDSYSFERKEGEMSVKEKVEYFNKEVRNQPQNIALWKEFVQFQDKVFEESSHIYDQAEDEERHGRKKHKQKSNRKALLEKKVAILDKALESNPKSLPLHMLKFEFLLELYKPKHVLTEWKKLCIQYQNMPQFWIEYLLFAASQLMVYSNTTMTGLFDTCFQKFNLMLNPQYPDFQRPKKFPLFISDMTFGLSLLMRNAGFVERAVALHQAQLEFDFYCPKDLFKDITLVGWKDDSKLFDTFWDAGTPRFGENGAEGWATLMKDVAKLKDGGQERVSIAVPDSKISDFEDETFDSLNLEMKSQFEEQEQSEEEEATSLEIIKHNQKPNIWLNMESCRTKLYWLPWRKACSDVDDCEDAQRVVISSDVTNFICPIPVGVNYVNEAMKQATHFRHIFNFIMTLREDFIPHTQAVDLVCSPFLSLSLTESSTLFSEIYYWRRLADLYVGINNSEPPSKAHHVFAPEGFKILDLTTPNLTTTAMLRPTFYDLTLKYNEQTSAEADEQKLKILTENDEKFMEMFHRVLETGIDLLEPEYSCLLFEMFVRFEQKLTCTRGGDVKQRIKFAKGLMQHQKLRNSIGGYRELAMLEYFGGNAQKAIDLLIKTINVTGKSLNLQDSEEVDWEKDWKSVVDLISLYRQLVELYLYQGDSTNDSKAYYTLIQLGNGFLPLEPQNLELTDDENLWKPKTNVLLKATRSFEKIMKMLIPSFSLKRESEAEGEEKDEEEKMADNNEVHLKWGGDKCVEYLLQKKNFIVEWTCCHALFQFFSKDFEAASQIYENVLDRLNGEQLHKRDCYNPELIRLHIREQLYINWCNLAARCLIKDPLMNSKFRNILGKSLEEFPSSPPLLLLFTDVENQTSVAGKLWRLMMANMKQDSDKIITHWAPLIMGIGLARKIEELEHDEEVGLPCFGLGGPAVPQDTIFYKLDSMISVAEQHPGARHCPLLWRVHLKMLALRAREGKDVQRSRDLFHDAIRHCPSSKALYLDGVTYFPDLLQEVYDLMMEKQLLIRLPLEELDVLLDMDEEAMQAEKTNENEEEEEEGDDDDIVEIDPKESHGKGGSAKKSRRSRSEEGEIDESD